MAQPNAEIYLDDLLVKPTLGQLDDLAVDIRSGSLLGKDVSTKGLTNSLLHGRLGVQVDGIGLFAPGQDAPHNVDIVNTYASGQTMARKVLSDASPAALHMVLDLPGRLDQLTGNYSAKSYGRLALALCTRAAYETRSDLLVYHSDGQNAGLLYEGPADEAYQVFNQVDGRSRRRDIDKTEPTLEGLLSAVQRNSEPENDALFVVSDFLDGYDADSNSFEWEKPLGREEQAFADRLWAVQLTSPAQGSIPSGMVEGLAFETVMAINANFADLAKRQASRLEVVFRDARHITVDTFRSNEAMHPVRKITKFVLGTQVE